MGSCRHGLSMKPSAEAAVQFVPTIKLVNRPQDNFERSAVVRDLNRSNLTTRTPHSKVHVC